MDSREFKARAIELWEGGDTQAAADGIALAPSYGNYPGAILIDVGSRYFGEGRSSV